MGKPTEEQLAWLQELEGMGDGGSDASGKSDAPNFGAESMRADSGPANVQLHEEKEPPNVKLPTATQGDPTVTMVVQESGATFEMRRSNLLKEDRYVDNAAHKMWARPANLATLEVKTMNFSGPRGKFSVELNDVRSDMPLPAMRFEMRGGIVYPINKNGEVAFDKVNTPQIVKFAQWVQNEIEQRRKIRRKITEAGFQFQIALAQLGAAVGPPHPPPGPQPSSVRVPSAPKPPIAEPVPPKPPPKAPSKTIVSSPPPPPPRPPAKPPGGGPPPGTTIVESPPPMPRPQPAPKIVKAPVEPAPAPGPKMTKEPSSPSNIGKAPTEPAPVEPPAQKPGGGPPPPEGGGPNSGKGNTVGETPPPAPAKPLTREEVLEIYERGRHRPLPPTQRVRIKTPKGAEEMTVAEYRQRHAQATEWMKQNPGKNVGTKFYDPSESYRQAAEKFGLDQYWHRPYGMNPYL